MPSFVYVVCGERIHIETLNLSLKFLRHFSKYPILVVTDSKRNEISIEHNQIIDIDTPIDLNHHEASIYLKTGLNRWVPDLENTTYCYLDSDIVAVSNNCDEIFNNKPNPIIFASDHCAFEEFSPHAMNCNCLERIVSKNERFPEIMEKINENFPLRLSENGTYDNPDKEKLDELFSDIKSNIWKRPFLAVRYSLLRYVLPVSEFNFKGYRFKKTNKCWYNGVNEVVDFDFGFYENKLKQNTGVGFDQSIPGWIYENGENITPEVPHCNHLSEYLEQKYNVSIPNNWRHWNGGVFLFNKTSVEFLEYWHKITIDEFQEVYSKTRDQGTLAATVWKFGLEEKNVLPKKFNWITEYANIEISWKQELGYTKDNFKSVFKPNLLHIYHHWGDAEWSIWESVINLKKQI